MSGLRVDMQRDVRRVTCARRRLRG